MARKNERNLNTLKQLITEATIVASGGVHAHAASGVFAGEELSNLIRATDCLHTARRLIEGGPDFTVYEGSAGPITD